MAEVRAAAPVVADAHVHVSVTFGHLDVGGGGAACHSNDPVMVHFYNARLWPR